MWMVRRGPRARRAGGPHLARRLPDLRARVARRGPPRRAAARADGLGAPGREGRSVSETLIELVAVRKRYRFGEALVNALDGVDLKVLKGEFLGVIGRSGSG